MDQGEIARVRALSLEAVLQTLGAERDPKDPRCNWRIGASRITVTESRFYDHNEAGALHRMRDGRAGGGGAIDLVQYVKDVGFLEAVRELGGVSAQTVLANAQRSRESRASRSSDQRPLPTPAAHQAIRAERYLTEVRGLPLSLVREEMASGEVFGDARGNVVFRLRNETGREVGYEVRGTTDTPYHSVHGEKGLFVTKADAGLQVAFVESAIEALSYRALGGTGLVVSTTGSAVAKPPILAQALQTRGYQIVLAFNADREGDRMAKRLQDALQTQGVRSRPNPTVGKDWNDQLRERLPAAVQPARAETFQRLVEGR